MCVHCENPYGTSMAYGNVDIFHTTMLTMNNVEFFVATRHLWQIMSVWNNEKHHVTFNEC